LLLTVNNSSGINYDSSSSSVSAPAQGLNGNAQVNNRIAGVDGDSIAQEWCDNEFVLVDGKCPTDVVRAQQTFGPTGAEYKIIGADDLPKSIGYHIYPGSTRVKTIDDGLGGRSNCMFESDDGVIDFDPAVESCGVFTDVKSIAVDDITVNNGLVWEPPVIQFVACINGLALALLDDSPGMTEGAAACVTGTNTAFGVMDLDAAADETTGQFRVKLPANVIIASGITATVGWFANTTSNAASVCVRTACVAATEALDPAFNTGTCVSTATNGTANRLNVSSITLDLTGCAAGETLFGEVYRDGNGSQATDSLTTDARFWQVSLSGRVTK
jgi:hypothetical protein